MALEKFASQFTIAMTSVELVMAQLLVTVRRAMKHFILIKDLAKNVLIIMEIAMGLKLFVFNVISNGYFSFKH